MPYEMHLRAAGDDAGDIGRGHVGRRLHRWRWESRVRLLLLRALPSGSALSPRGALRARGESRRLLHFRTDWQALDDLDARSPRISDVGDRVAGGALANRLVE